MAAEVYASAVVKVHTPCSVVVWRVPATYSIRQFPLHFPSLRHRVPSHFNWTLLQPVDMTVACFKQPNNRISPTRMLVFLESCSPTQWERKTGDAVLANCVWQYRRNQLDLHTCTPEHPNTCTPEYLHTWTPEHMHTCNLNTWTPAHLNTCTPAHMNTWTPEHMHTCNLNTWTPAHLNTCTPEHLHTLPGTGTG